MLDSLKTIISLLVVLSFLIGCGSPFEYRASDEAMLLQQAEVDVFHIINMQVPLKEQGLMKAIVPLYLQILKTKIKIDKRMMYVTRLDVEYAYRAIPVFGSYKDKFTALVVYQRELK